MLICISGQYLRESPSLQPKTNPAPFLFVLQVRHSNHLRTGLHSPCYLFADNFQKRFPPNIVRNQKYNVITFLPIVFYEQFKFFFNLYFLLVALSQFIPALKIGKL